MLHRSLIQNLTQTNISVDKEKTKVRLTELWGNASETDKKTVIRLAGAARSAVERSCKLGNISAKLVVPLAKTLYANPFYLTGEIDECYESSDELLIEFLVCHGYESLLCGDSVNKPI